MRARTSKSNRIKWHLKNCRIWYRSCKSRMLVGHRNSMKPSSWGFMWYSKNSEQIPRICLAVFFAQQAVTIPLPPCWVTCWSTNSLQKSPSWETFRRSAGQKNLCFLWNPKYHYHVHNSSVLDHVMSQLHPIHTLISCLIKNMIFCVHIN